MIKLGTPYVQVIPFKREEWKMSIKPVNSEVMEKNKFNFFLNLAQFYKKNKWSKKKFK